MEVLNVLKELISETSRTAVKKSGELVETTRIRFAILGAETEISKMLREIGDVVMDEYLKGGREYSDAVAEKCAAVAELMSGIKELNDRMNEIRDLRECGSCQTKVPAEFVFCPRCGKSLPEQEEPAAVKDETEVESAEASSGEAE